jgi:beta propeller repeat protein
MRKAIEQSAFLILFVGFVMSPAAGSSETPCIEDEGETIAITTDPADQIQPAISGNLVVWADDRDEEGIYKVYLYDLANPDQEPKPITPEVRARRQLVPRISGRRIVWADQRHGRSVYVYDLDSGGEPQAIATGIDRIQGELLPDIDGDWVAWTRWNGIGIQLEMLNLVTKETRAISGGNNFRPTISGNTVLWNRSHPVVVFLHDLGDDDPHNEIPLTDTDFSRNSPDVSGDHAVWNFHSGTAPFAEYRNLATGEGKVLTEAHNIVSRPRIFGNRVVWTGRIDFSNSNVYVYDLAEGSAGRIVCDPVFAPYVDVDSNRVVWADDRNGNWDIYMFEFNTPPTADAGADQRIIVGETVQLDGGGSSDPDGDPLAYHWMISKPDLTILALSEEAPTFVADLAGTYDVELVVNDGLRDSDPDQATITAITPVDAVLDLITSVETLLGDGRGLVRKLEQTIAALERGKVNVAVNKLRDFTDQVAGLVKAGALTAEDGEELIGAALRIISVLE